MTPYYEDSAVTIYHGDCREIVPTLGRFDLLLTDPPYGVAGGSGTKGLDRSHKHNYNGADDSLSYIVNEVIPVVVACLDLCDGRGIVTPGTKAMCFYPQPDSFGVFNQPATCGMQSWGRTDAQPIFYYGRDPRVGKTIGFCSTQVTLAAEKNGHPCPKPLKPWTWLLHKGSLQEETVLDPFAGSCTTGRAAKDLGRKCVCIEREECYCEIGARRMAQEVFSF